MENIKCTKCNDIVLIKDCVSRVYYDISEKMLKPRLGVMYECPKCKINIVLKK